MKKRMAMVAIMAVCMAAVPAAASDLEVHEITIPGNEDEMEVLDLEDMQIGTTYKIDGYAKVTPYFFDFMDCFAQYTLDNAGEHSCTDGHNNYIYDNPVKCSNSTSNGYWNIYWNDSGANADFAWLVMDITNLRKENVAFMQEASVKVVYDEEYEFEGWIRQINYDYRTPIHRRDYKGKYYIVESSDDGNYDYSDVCIDPENEEEIGQMFVGSYVFGCTLPNPVIEDENAPLKIMIQLGENELTYHVRK